jgi:hypothetical protein
MLYYIIFFFWGGGVLGLGFGGKREFGSGCGWEGKGWESRGWLDFLLGRRVEAFPCARFFCPWVFECLEHEGGGKVFSFFFNFCLKLGRFLIEWLDAVELDSALWISHSSAGELAAASRSFVRSNKSNLRDQQRTGPQYTTANVKSSLFVLFFFFFFFWAGDPSVRAGCD